MQNLVKYTVSNFLGQSIVSNQFQSFDETGPAGFSTAFQNIVFSVQPSSNHVAQKEGHSSQVRIVEPKCRAQFYKVLIAQATEVFGNRIVVSHC